MHPIFCAHLIIYFGVLNLDIITFTVYTTFGVLTLCNLWAICIPNRFHSFIFKLCIMIVYTLKICTNDADPEQSLVLLAHLSHWLMVSFCDRWMSVVYRVLSIVCRQQLLQLTSPKLQTGFWPNLVGMILIWPSFKNCSNGSGPLHI